MNIIRFSVVLRCALGTALLITLAGCPTVQGPTIAVVNSVSDLRTALTGFSAAGGRVVVKAGTYILTDSVEVTADNIVIEGEGAATQFRMANGVNRPCFILGDPDHAQPAVTHRNIELRNMRIDGNRANQTSELSAETDHEYLRNNCITVRGCVDTTVKNVILQSARSGGIVTEKGCENIVLEGITAFDNEFDGIACYETTSSLITGCTSRDNVAAGLSCDLSFDGNVVTNSFFIDNGTVGVFWRDSAQNLLSNSVMAENGQDGVFLADGDAPTNLPATGNTFIGNFYTDNGRNGIWQAGANSTNNVLVGGVFRSNGAAPIQESFPNTAPLIRNTPPVIL
jgi:hypothetical protein